jgi:hypothetical protein
MTNYPGVTLDNGVLKATIRLPDASRGYYRGTRFDWSGLVSQVEFKGHTYFGELKRPHKPTVHDHAAGLCDEFGMGSPLGYNEVKRGGAFLKIGVGTLLRGKEPRYGFHLDYAIAEPAPWDIQKDGARITFTQKVTGPRGWGYRYVKTVALEKGRPILSVRHVLANTGRKRIRTDHYCHNMFIFDQQPVGRPYRVAFTFPPKALRPSPEQANLQECEFRFVEKVLKGHFWSPLIGYTLPRHKTFVVLHDPSGLSLKVSTARAPSKICMYAEKTAVCPETFVSLDVAPGRSITWTTEHEFGTR